MLQTRDNTVYTENSIRTFTGKVFDLKILDPESICIEDIAHALSNTARFGGHLKEFYSVAQHSVHMAQMASENFKLEALLHDASEAYLGDMPSPFKRIMPEYKEYENKLMQVIADKFGFSLPISGHIKYLDKQILQMEWDSFVEPIAARYEVPLWAWDPELAEAEFMKMWYSLTE